jgi:hypothetical protein
MTEQNRTYSSTLLRKLLSVMPVSPNVVAVTGICVATSSDKYVAYIGFTRDLTVNSCGGHKDAPLLRVGFIVSSNKVLPLARRNFVLVSALFA